MYYSNLDKKRFIYLGVDTAIKSSRQSPASLVKSRLKVFTHSLTYNMDSYKSMRTHPNFTSLSREEIGLPSFSRRT